jgi:cyanophycinase
MTTDPDDQYGTLIAIGGAEDREQELEVLSKVFSFAPEDSDEVTVIATASGVPEEILPVYEEAFQRVGASKVHCLPVRERQDAADPESIELIQRSGVVFFTGGDQLRLTNVLGGSSMLKAIRNHYASGGVIAGTSAGAVAQSTTMIYNGGAADALHKGAVKMSSGLGFVEGIIIDSHFLERGRFTRLMEVGATNPEYLGVGLGEDAAVIVHRNRVLEAIGNGHVIIVDTRDLASSNIAELAMGEAVAIENVVMHALISGHGFDIDARRYLDPEALQKKMQEAE